VATQASLVEQVIARCSERRFTGLLRVHALEGQGELSFLSGIRDTIVFDAMDGEEAMERLIRATTQEFEAIPRLPPFNERSSQPLPQSGPLGPMLRPVNLLRYCESQSLTCTLDLNVEGRAVRINYEVGDLVSVEPESAEVSALLEANVGNYRINLPSFELPEAARSKPAPVVATPARRRQVETVNATPRAAAAAAARNDVRIDIAPAVAVGAPQRPPSVTIPASRKARDDRDVVAAAASPSSRARPPVLPDSPRFEATPPMPLGLAAPAFDQRPLAGEPRPASAPPSADRPRAKSPPPFESPVQKPRPPLFADEPASAAAAPASAAVSASAVPPAAVPPAAAVPPPAAVPASPRPGRPEYLVSTQRSGRRVQEPAPRQVAPSALTSPPAAPRGGKQAATSLEPWSPASGPASQEAAFGEQRQSGMGPYKSPSSQRYYFWVWLALAVLGVLAYVLLS
jgi:hypothetical protein